MTTEAIYRTVCRECDHHIRQSFRVDSEFVNSNPGRRIRCAECGTTNHIAKPEGAE